MSSDKEKDLQEKCDECDALKRRFDSVQKIVQLGCWEWDIVNDTLYWSDGIYRLFDLDPNEFEATYESFLEHIHPDDREYVNKSVEKALAGETEYNIFHRVVLKDGTEKIVNERADITFDKDGKPTMMVGMVHNVTELKAKEQELEKLTAVIENSENMIIITDTDSHIEYVNEAFICQTGFTKEDVIGQTPRMLSAGLEEDNVSKGMYEALEKGETWRGNFKNKDVNGKPFWVHASISPVRNFKGEITHYISVQENITAKMLAEEQIEVLSSFDEVTGTFNRKKFLAVFDNWLNYGTTNSQRGALLTVNIDDFKTINDTYGHMAGDNVLRYISDVIKKVLILDDEKYSDIDSYESFIARFSADEFSVFLPKRDDKSALKVCEKLGEAIGAKGFGEMPVQLRVSIGVSFFPGHGVSSGDLLSKSNIACMKVKDRGGNNVYVFNEKDRDFSKISHRVAWQDKIARAIENDTFVPWFQPIQNIATGEITHYEALVRLVEGDKVYAPGNFIDVAEQTGTIGSIDRIMMVKAMDFIKQVNSNNGHGNAKVSINISGNDIGDSSFIGFIRKVVKEKEVDPSSLIFEITETAAVNDLAVAKGFIEDLKSMGISFALDDFGVGFTSFKYLQEMAIDYIKIDGSFIRNLDKNDSDKIFVKAIVDVAHALGVKTVAEYVENEPIIDIVRDLNVDYAQGYFVSKPVPKEELLPQA